MPFLHVLACAIVGHRVDNHELEHERDHRCCCGAEYLRRDGTTTRLRHTLSCFFGTHDYRRLDERDGCREYVCVQCGHPLVYPAGADPYADVGVFKKKVRYRCGLFGHRAQVVARRNGLVEHACHCGHSFLLAEQHDQKIHHPVVCVLSGHFVSYVTSRNGFDEFICVNCGHPFCFARATPRLEHRLE